MAAALHAKAPAPSRVRTNCGRSAQFIESRRHRKTLTDVHGRHFRSAGRAEPAHGGSLAWPAAVVVDSWYDDAFAARSTNAGRDGLGRDPGHHARAGSQRDIWTRAYDAAGATVRRRWPIEAARTVLYKPHGGVTPAQNFLVADSDYVEV